MRNLFPMLIILKKVPVLLVYTLALSHYCKEIIAL